MNLQITAKKSSFSLAGFSFVVIVAAAVIFARLGSFPLFNPDEALYAEPAREMLEIGDYITTYLNYVIRFTKPPLAIWAMAFFIKVFGVSEFAVRFFGASCGVALVGATYAAASRYFGTTAAIIAGLSLVTAPLFVGTAREAITDMPLALFMACAQLAFFRGFESSSPRFSYLAWVMVGLAVMTKGPVGLILPMAILFGYHLLRGDLKEAFKRYKVIWGLLIVALIAVPWFAVEIYVTKGAYYQEFIVRENFQRFTANVDAHKQPVWYHLAAMFVGFMPFAIYLPQALWRFLIKCRNMVIMTLSAGKDTKTRYEFVTTYLRQMSIPQSLLFYCAIWSLGTLVFFSMSVSKLLPYTLPAFPALSLIVCAAIDTAIKTKHFRNLAFPLLLLVLVYGGCGFAAPLITGRLRDAPPELVTQAVDFVKFSAGSTFVAIILLRLYKMKAAMIFFAAASCLGLTYYAMRIIPIVSNKWEGPLTGLSRYAGESKLPIIVYEMRKPGVPFYARRKVENINGQDVLKARLSGLKEAYVLTKAKQVSSVTALAGTKLQCQDGDFALLYYGPLGDSKH